MDLGGGLVGAGRFLYLAKNAFSGKIRFNRSNRFNTPMRKGANCPVLDAERFRRISASISRMDITNENFEGFADIRGAFLYLDPPYMNNTNGHYNGVPATGSLPGSCGRLPAQHGDDIRTKPTRSDRHPGIIPHTRYNPARSLQYVTQTTSREIIATNYG